MRNVLAMTALGAGILLSSFVDEKYIFATIIGGVSLFLIILFGNKKKDDNGESDNEG